MTMKKFTCILILHIICVHKVTSQKSNYIDNDNDSSFYRVGSPTSGNGVHPMSLVGSNNELHSNITEEKYEDKITDILHGILSKYDNRIRPFYPDAPLFVTVSFGGIQVVDVLEGREELVSVLLLQQKWIDPRLAFIEDSSGVEEITIAHDHTNQETMFWLPDTFFENEKKPLGQESSVANDAIILYKNGTVFRTVRMTVSTHCDFEYLDFPFDSQVCGLRIGSHAYRTTDVTYGWDEQFIADVDIHVGGEEGARKVPVVSSRHTGMFIVTGISLSESTQQFNYGNLSRLTFQITLQRAWKPFIYRFYLPMVLFVFVSLGTMFFGDYRVALILNLFNLALINIFVAIRSTSTDLPSKSPSQTAYDSYFNMCICYISIVLIITAIKLVKSNRTNTSQSYATQQPSSSASASVGNHFPETLVLRQNRRRRSNEHDIFNPEENGDSFCSREESGGGGGERDSEFQQIYRSCESTTNASPWFSCTTQPKYRVTVRWRVVWRKVVKFGGWFYKHLRWILIVTFLITDYTYFKVNSVQYS